MKIKIGDKLRSAIEHLTKHAPLIAEAILGSRGMAALEVVKTVLGISPTENDNEKVAEAILKADPNKLLELSKLEKDFRKFLISTELEDRRDARALAAHRGIYIQAGISALFIVVYMLIARSFFGAFFSPVPIMVNGEMLGLFGIVFGVLTGAIPQILQFWFGSSEGSKTKTDGIVDALRK